MFIRRGSRADEIDWGKTLFAWGIGLAVIKLALMGLVRLAIVVGIIAASVGAVVIVYQIVSAVSANRRRLPAPPPVAMLRPPK